MAWRVFYSYAHADEALRDKLGIYLKPLVIHKMITDWYDRKIDPGANWATEISDRLQSADLILLLVSENFLASDYCFGAEVETALDRLKLGGVKVVPILLKPCLWELSPFSELQIIPRDAKAIISWPSKEEAFNSVVSEIRTLVSSPPPPLGNIDADVSPSSLDLVRGQVRSHARLYERIRQRMSASSERTQRMEQVRAGTHGHHFIAYGA